MQGEDAEELGSEAPGVLASIIHMDVYVPLLPHGYLCTLPLG